MAAWYTSRILLMSLNIQNCCSWKNVSTLKKGNGSCAHWIVKVGSVSCHFVLVKMQNGSGASLALLITMVLRWETGTSCSQWLACFMPRFLRMRTVWELEIGLWWYPGRADTHTDLELLMAVAFGRGASAFFRLASCFGLWSSVGAWKCMALPVQSVKRKWY